MSNSHWNWFGRYVVFHVLRLNIFMRKYIYCLSFCVVIGTLECANVVACGLSDIRIYLYKYIRY